MDLYWRRHLTVTMVSKLISDATCSMPPTLVSLLNEAKDDQTSKRTDSQDRTVEQMVYQDVLLINEQMVVEQVICIIRNLRRNPANADIIIEHPYALYIIAAMAASRSSPFVAGAKRDACDCLVEMCSSLCFSDLETKKSEFVLWTIRYLTCCSQDRLDVITGLDMIAGLCRNDRSRKLALGLTRSRGSEFSLLERVTQLTKLKDAGVTTSTLECLYGITLELNGSLSLADKPYVADLISSLVSMLRVNAISRYYPSFEGNFKQLTIENSNRLDLQIRDWMKSLFEASPSVCLHSRDIIAMVASAPFLPKFHYIGKNYIYRTLFNVFPSAFYKDDLIFGLNVKENATFNGGTLSDRETVGNVCGSGVSSNSIGGTNQTARRRTLDDDSEDYIDAKRAKLSCPTNEDFRTCEDVCKVLVSTIEFYSENDLETRAICSQLLLVNRMSSQCVISENVLKTYDFILNPRPVHLYECSWDYCTCRCASLKHLHRHFLETHFDIRPLKAIKCKWRGCPSPYPRPVWSFAVHIKDHLLRNPIGITSNLGKTARDISDSLTEDRRIPLDIQALGETPIFEVDHMSRSFRLSAALILRNIATCPFANDYFKSNQRTEIARLAACNNELCVPLTKCLYAITYGTEDQLNVRNTSNSNKRQLDRNINARTGYGPS
ncbi:hypothetical protein ACOME3_008855 [Neoechinorhynchus agilis]